MQGTKDTKQFTKPRKRQPALTRSALLTAAGELAAETGGVSFSIEKVARRAGVSKGALLHHFPNKDLLITCLIEKLADEFCDTVEEYASQDGQEYGRYLRAYALAVGSQSQAQFAQWRAVDTALSANKAGKKSIWRGRFSGMIELDEKLSVDLPKFNLIRLALDGLWYLDLHKHHELEVDMRAQVLEHIVSMTRR